MGIRNRSRTLRSTLARWLELACALAVIVLSVVLVLVRRGSDRQRQDATLLAGAEQMIAELGAEDVARASDERLKTCLPAGIEHGSCALRARGGRVLAAWNVRRAELLPPVASPMPRAPLSASFVSLDSEVAAALVGSEVGLRMVTLPFRDHDELYFVQLAGPEVSWAGSLAELLVPLLGGALVLALTARFAASLIVRRVLSPLGGLAEGARQLSPSNLGGRLRVQTADVELQRLEEELNAALQRMEEGYKAQAHFASNVAHELKTPIAALVTDAQVSRLGGRDPERSYAFMGRAEQELRHLGELVESLLVMARVDSRESRAELVYVDDVLRRAVSRCRSLADESGVGLQLELAPPTDSCDRFVRGDAQLLQAMVENLLRNAIHHSPRGARVDVGASCGAGVVRIAVQDQGPGIPEEIRRLVFERGVRAASRVRGANGAGLGLAIVSSVAQLHGGTAVLERSERGGCSFVVVLPAERSATNAAPRL